MLMKSHHLYLYKHIFRRISTRTPSFRVLDDTLDSRNQDFELAAQRSCQTSSCLAAVQQLALAGGGEKAIKKHTVMKKKLLIRERLKRLFDEGSPFLEIGMLAGLGMEYGNVPAGALVVGIGQIHGHYCIAGGSDATVKGGSFYPITVEKNLRTQRLSAINRIPGIAFVDSGGAYLPLQSEVFPDRDHGGRSFRNEAVSSANGIPQITIVAGSCTAGGAYGPTMSEEAIIVDQIGTIFLAGPPLVKAATGEVTSEQELGGADLHCRVSGCTDYFAETEDEAIEMCRESVLTLNLQRPLSRTDYSEPLYPPSDLNGIAGKEEINKNDIYAVISRVVDGSGFKEFKQKFGSYLITGFAFLCGHLVGILANCGPISCADAQKGTHFIQLCQKRAVPMIFLQNSGVAEMVDSSIEGETVKDRGKMVAAHTCAKVPKITINVGGCHGDENFTMCGWSFKPNFFFSWPMAETHFSEKAPNKNIERKEPQDEDERLLTQFQNKGSAFYRSSRMLQDGIILPEETRKTLGLCLDIIHSGISAQQYWREEQLAVIRM